MESAKSSGERISGKPRIRVVEVIVRTLTTRARGLTHLSHSRRVAIIDVGADFVTINEPAQSCELAKIR